MSTRPDCYGAIAVRRGLYAIADADACERVGAPLEETALALVEARPAAVQLRWKGAPAGAFLAVCRRVLARGRARGVLVIVNDRVDVACLAGADGVHLGQGDLPVDAARTLLPPGALIGLSTHDLTQVKQGLQSGADYLGFGPVFPTGSKLRPDPVVGLAGLEAACRLAAGTPVVAIGGVRRETVPDIRTAGAHAVAMIGELLGPDGSPPTVRERAAHLDRDFREER